MSASSRFRSYIRQPRRLIVLSSLVGIVIISIWTHRSARKAIDAFYSIDSQYRNNLLLTHTPEWAKDRMLEYNPGIIWNVNPLSPIEGLIDGVWMGNFSIPALDRPTCAETKLPHTPPTPAILMIHFFSSAFPKSRGRRDLIRKLSPLNQIPPAYRHLFEVKFVLGRSSDTEWEKALDEEQASYGDLIRLDGLRDGENMDKGKTTHWMRYVGRAGARRAWWVMKCDDDNLPLMPNLLPWLLVNDPSKPHYVGTTMQRDPHLAPYMNGFFYGFSWPVIKTVATAAIPASEIDREYWEDARTGQLMYSLPTQPGVEYSWPTQWTNDKPLSPDPRTGLIRLDAGERMTDVGMWWGSGWYKAIAWHRMKSDDEYVAAHEAAVTGFKGVGWELEWSPPRRFKKYALHC